MFPKMSRVNLVSVTLTLLAVVCVCLMSGCATTAQKFDPKRYYDGTYKTVNLEDKANYFIGPTYTSLRNKGIEGIWATFIMPEGANTVELYVSATHEKRIRFQDAFYNGQSLKLRSGDEGLLITHKVFMNQENLIVEKFVIEIPLSLTGELVCSDEQVTVQLVGTADKPIDINLPLELFYGFFRKAWDMGETQIEADCFDEPKPF